MNSAIRHEAPISTSFPAAANAGTVVDTRGTATGGPRILLRFEGAAALAAATSAYESLGGRWLVFAILFLVPDLAMLGYLAGAKIGAACYNAAHSYVGPAILGAIGVAGGGAMPLLVACIWMAHIGFDRLLGYGLKYGTRFGDTHLGRLPSRDARPAS